MPMRGELPAVAARTYAPATAKGAAWSRFIAAISDRELQFVVAFCAIGFLLAINVILRYPDFGALFAQTASFG
jgi:hypothetical protein